MLRASDGILDMLPIATFICDAKGAILQYNAAPRRSGAASRNRARRTNNSPPAPDIFDIDGRPLQRSELAEVLATGKPARDVERIVERMDGRASSCRSTSIRCAMPKAS